MDTLSLESSGQDGLSQEGRRRHSHCLQKDQAVAIEPRAFLNYLKLRPDRVPHTAILCFQPFAIRELSAQRQIVSYRLGTRKAYALKEGKQRWAVVEAQGIGAPAAVLTLEELSALGVRQVMTVGGAGALQPELALGDVVICNRAYRDEGTSGHYLGAGYPPHLSVERRERVEELSLCLSEAGIEHRVGATWTTDAPYRETWEKVRQYQRKGVLNVDMEASALMAVGRFRGMTVIPTFVVSDRLSGGYWEPGFRDKVVAKAMVKLLDIVCRFANRKPQ